jgi:hypothetical protein
MGTLKPGATYIYERADGIVYAREMGAEPNTRKEVGWSYDSRTPDGRLLQDHVADHQLWPKIHRAAQTNPALKDALDRVIMIYNLSKINE